MLGRAVIPRLSPAEPQQSQDFQPTSPELRGTVRWPRGYETLDRQEIGLEYGTREAPAPSPQSSLRNHVQQQHQIGGSVLPPSKYFIP